MEDFKFTSFDGKELQSYLFEKVEKPLGVIQIIHGMKEYSNRYFDFIKFLNTNNFIVFISDLRGHGLTSDSIESLGFSEGDIYKECLQDQLEISKFLKEKYPDLPLNILGHSFGSFVSQGYILKNQYAVKIVLSGSAYNNTLLFKMANLIAKTTRLFKGKKGSAKLIEKLSFSSYEKKFENGNWLSRNENVFKAYNEDKFCGTPFPINFYCSMFSNTTKNYKRLKLINKKAKLFVIAGKDDPVGSYGKSVLKLSKTYQKSGFKTTTKLYDEYRHEILNELNKTQVYNDVVNFLKFD